MRQHRPVRSRVSSGGKSPILSLGLLVLAVVGAWAALGPVHRLHAQESPQLASLEIAVWPEFDRPAVLVILRGEVAADVPLPAPISLHIPVSSGGPSAVASTTTVGGPLVNLTYEVTEAEDSLLLTLTTPDPVFQVEFYDPLPTDSPEREYTYVWPADLPVEQLSVRVQEPAGAAVLSVEPDLGTGTVEADGLAYRTAELGQFDVGETLEIQVRYRKTDPRTSLEILSPVEEPGSDGGVPSFLLPVALAVVAALAVGAVIYWRAQRRPAPAARAPAGTRRRDSPARRSQEAASRQAFCTQCGHPLDPDDRFCSRCGTQVRDK